MRCKVANCNNEVGQHGAHGMCTRHYQQSRAKIKVCPRCGETKKFYNNSTICKACEWWEKHHDGDIRKGPIRIRDRVKSSHPVEYSIYRGIKNRCLNEKNTHYADYGGRGIYICDRWEGPFGFHHFYEDMGDRPGAEYSIDRIDVDGPYSPENCRWAGIWTQSTNKRDHRMYSRQIGVTYNKSLGLWVATLKKNGKIHVKYSKTEEGAIVFRKQLEDSYC